MDQQFVYAEPVLYTRDVASYSEHVILDSLTEFMLSYADPTTILAWLLGIIALVSFAVLVYELLLRLFHCNDAQQRKYYLKTIPTDTCYLLIFFSCVVLLWWWDTVGSFCLLFVSIMLLYDCLYACPNTYCCLKKVVLCSTGVLGLLYALNRFGFCRFLQQTSVQTLLEMFMQHVLMLCIVFLIINKLIQ